jgi:hypothetical protein
MLGSGYANTTSFTTVRRSSAEFETKKLRDLRGEIKRGLRLWTRKKNLRGNK